MQHATKQSINATILQIMLEANIAIDIAPIVVIVPTMLRALLITLLPFDACSRASWITVLSMTMESFA